MSLGKKIFIALICFVICEGLALFVFFMIPSKSIAVAELIGNDHVLSSDGLGRILRVNPVNSVEMQSVAQLLTSRSAAEYAVAESSELDADTFVDRITVKNEQGGIKLMVSAKGDELAVQLADRLLEHTKRTSRQIREYQVQSLRETVENKVDNVLHEIEKKNGEISEILKTKNIVITSENEREQILAFLLSSFETQISELTLREVELTNRLQGKQHGGDEQSESSFRDEFEEIGETFALSRTRQNLVDQESLLGALKVRYGENNRKVREAEAELDVTKENLMGLLEAQRQLLGVSVDSSLDSIEILRNRIFETMQAFQEMDISYDSEIVNLQTALEALTRTYQELQARKTELLVYQNVDSPAFFVITQPYIAKPVQYKQVAGVMVIGAAAAAVITFMILLLTIRRKIPISSYNSADKSSFVHDEKILERTEV